MGEIKADFNLREHLMMLHKNALRDFRWKNLGKIVKKYIKGPFVLDAGCGTGHFTLELIEEGYSVTAIDRDDSLISFLKSILETNKNDLKNISCKCLCMDIADMWSLGMGRFDTVVMLDVLEHIENDLEALKASYYVLKRGGRIVLSVPAHPVLYSKRDEVMGHFRRYRKKELEEKMKMAGFKVLEIRFWNFIGVLPYFLQKIFRLNLDSVRYSEEKSKTSKFINSILDYWFHFFENNFKLPMGLSLIAVGEKFSD